VTLLLAVLLVAQDPPPEVRHTFNVIEENDFFAHVSASDRHYTQGLRLEYHVLDLRQGALLPVRGLYREGTSHSNGAAAGQEMYTPEDITDPLPQPGDRPYAAWLYVGFITTMIDRDRRWQDTWELDVGTVGPHALGDEIQSGWHALIGAENPTWAGQLPNEIGVNASWKREWVHEAFEEPGADWGARMITDLGIKAGTVACEVAVGAHVLFGYRVPSDVAGARAFRPLPGPREWGLRLYGFAGVEGRFVPWNLFLDGTVFRDSASVDRKYLTADFSAGLILKLGDGIGVSYGQSFRSGEISSDPRYQNFGTVVLSWTVGF
jgi:lipid A 3-O-deacylase